MGHPSTARETLHGAHMFLEEAEHEHAGDLKRCLRLMEASIVFGRSVTFHLQKQYGSHAGFKAWYEDQQNRLKGDPLCGFFLEKRNVILKEGRSGIRRIISYAVHLDVTVGMSVEGHVIRAVPWYRRSPRIWRQDVWAWGLQLADKIRGLRRDVRAMRPMRAEDTDTNVDFFFDDPEWARFSATDLIRNYLNNLEPIVDEAETKFAEPENEDPACTGPPNT